MNTVALALLLPLIIAAAVLFRSLYKDDRPWFEIANYGTLRNRGLTHRQAIEELDRMWERRTGA